MEEYTLKSQAIRHLIFGVDRGLRRRPKHDLVVQNEAHHHDNRDAQEVGEVDREGAESSAEDEFTDLDSDPEEDGSEDEAERVDNEEPGDLGAAGAALAAPERPLAVAEVGVDERNE